MDEDLNEPIVLDEFEEVEPEELSLDLIDLDVEGFEGYPEEEEDDDSTDLDSGTPS